MDISCDLGSSVVVGRAICGYLAAPLVVATAVFGHIQLPVERKPVQDLQCFSTHHASENREKYPRRMGCGHLGSWLDHARIMVGAAVSWTMVFPVAFDLRSLCLASQRLL